MKKIFISFILLSLLGACHLPKYVLENTTSYVNFSEGRWLLNDIQAPHNIEPVLKGIAVKRFSYFLNDRLYDLSNANGVIVPKYIPLNPNSALLKDLKNGTGFDYFINIKSGVLKNALGSIQFGDNGDDSMNTGEITVEIYNLNTSEIIFRQKSYVSNGAEIFTEKLSFAKSANGLIVGGLEKIMKELKKNAKK